MMQKAATDPYETADVLDKLAGAIPYLDISACRGR